MSDDLFDDATADALLSGALDASEAPAGLERVAALVAAVNAPIDRSSLSPPPDLLAAMLAEVRPAPVLSSRRRRKSMLGKIVTAKAAAIAVAALTASGAAAAAGTGSLPAPVQTAVSSGLSHVGVEVPDGHGHSGQGQNGNQGGNQNGSSSGPSDNSLFGRCTAYLAAPQGSGAVNSASADHSRKNDAPAFEGLDEATCSQVVADHNQQPQGGDNNGQPGTSGQQGGQGNQGQPGNPGQNGKPANPGPNNNAGQPGQPGGTGAGAPNGGAPVTPARTGRP